MSGRSADSPRPGRGGRIGSLAMCIGDAAGDGDVRSWTTRWRLSTPQRDVRPRSDTTLRIRRRRRRAALEREVEQIDGVLHAAADGAVGVGIARGEAPWLRVTEEVEAEEKDRIGDADHPPSQGPRRGDRP